VGRGTNQRLYQSRINPKDIGAACKIAGVR
jgi:hypothetical protein